MYSPNDVLTGEGYKFRDVKQFTQDNIMNPELRLTQKFFLCHTWEEKGLILLGRTLDWVSLALRLP